MAATRSVVLPDVRRTAGTYVSLAQPLASTITRVGVALARKGWTLTGRDEVIQAAVEVSQDNGTSWLEIGAVGSVAGEILQKDGSLATETTMLARLPRALPGRGALLARVRVLSFAPCEGLVELMTDDAPIPLLPPVEHRSVSYDSDGENTATNATSVTISSLTVGNNANRLLIVGIAAWDGNTADSVVSSVSWNGSTTGFAEVITAVGPGASTNRSSIWRLIAPTAATASVVVTVAAATAELGANALSAYDVNQTTPLGTAVTDENTTTTATVTVSDAADDDLVYDAVYISASSLANVAAGAGQTERMNSAITAGSQGCASTQLGSVSGDVMSWTFTGSFSEWVQTAVALKAAAAGGRTTKNTRSWPLGVEIGMGWQMPI